MVDMLDEGKVNHELLRKLTELSGYSYDGIISKARPGSDVAVLDMMAAKKRVNSYYNTNGEPFIVYKSDPITFPTSRPGWWLITVNMNDISTAGALPVAMTVTMLIPPGTSREHVLEIQKDLHRTAKGHNIAIMGGHTEVTSSVNSLVLSGNLIGLVPPEYHVVDDLSAGDKIIISGYVGAEGTGILLDNEEFWKDHLKPEEIQHGKDFSVRINISQRTLHTIKRHHNDLSMVHDITEGGLLTAVYEAVEPMGLGANLHDSLPIAEVTKKICGTLGIDPLQLIGSGAVLLFCKSGSEDQVLDTLRTHDHFPAKIIGEVTAERSFTIANRTFNQTPDALIDGLETLEKLRKGN